MTDVLIVSRHPAAVEFVRAASPDFAGAPVMTGNVTADDVRGKHVAGNIPLHLAQYAASVTAVEFDGDPPRGAEYTAEDMSAAGAHLCTYRVEWAMLDRPHIPYQGDMFYAEICFEQCSAPDLWAALPEDDPGVVYTSGGDRNDGEYTFPAVMKDDDGHVVVESLPAGSLVLCGREWVPAWQP